MIGDGDILKKILSSGEEQFSKIAADLVGNEKFMAALQTAATKTLEAKGVMDKQFAAALAAMHVPTAADVQKLNERLDEVERIFEGLIAKVDAIAAKMDAK